MLAKLNCLQISRFYRELSQGARHSISVSRGVLGRLDAGPIPVPLRFHSWDAGESTAVRLSAAGAVRHDVAHQVAHIVLQISDDVLDDVSDRNHAHDLAGVKHR